MSGGTPSVARLPLKEEEDDTLIKLQKYVDQLSLEGKEAMRVILTPSKPTPIIKRGVIFDKIADHW